MDDKHSRTEKESWAHELGDSHHKTTISDGQHKAEGRSYDADESSKIAHDKWEKGETSDVGCFITTACITAQGLPDTCEELDIFRQLRDEYVSKLPEGESLIREYYQKAPKIILAINKTKTSKNIYNMLFRELVTKTVLLFKANKKKEAFQHCVTIIRGLEEEYIE
jgi:hypothetical protein